MERGNRPTPPVGIEAVLLTGGGVRHYAFGLAMALISQGVCLDIIGSDETDSPELHATTGLRFLNLRGDQRRNASLTKKISRVLLYYARLLRYAVIAKPRVFHILWNNRFEFFDRTLLMLYYKLLGKTIVFTAHNVNIGKRDSCDTLLNRLTLRMQYRLSDHIFVHTERMKRELLEEFGVCERAVTVVPFGINNAVPDTDLTPAEAKQRLGIRGGQRTILFFGSIAPYKGLDLLVAAFQRILAGNADYRLIIAGRPKGGCEKYLHEIQQTISGGVGPGSVIQKIRFIPDEEIELYFKAADVLALPYTRIFQSGVLFLGFSFGLPAVAADVGSFGEDIIEGRTGFLCKPGDPVDLAKVIETYFASELFRCLDSRRRDIREYMSARHSWDVVGKMTRDAYAELLGSPPPGPS
jgi:D-inositol-3-phosphate glycosyltransferase